MIRHLLLKVESPSLEDSLLLIDSMEAKKAPQDTDQSHDKSKGKSLEKNDADDQVSKEESKDGE